MSSGYSLRKIPRRPLVAHVQPAASPLSGTLLAQPSKNYTTRCLLAASLAGGTSRVCNVALSEDAEALQHGLKCLGVKLKPEASEESLTVTIDGIGGCPHLVSPDAINVGNAGAVLRLLLGTGALLSDVTFITDRPDSLGKRPNDELLDALQQLGCQTTSHDGKLPITLHGGDRLHGGTVSISGARSSQFLSSLLFLSPLVGEKVVINVLDGLVSKAPVQQTLEVLSQAGVKVTAAGDLLHFEIEPQAYRAGTYHVNGDWPGSAAILAAAAVTNSTVTMNGLHDDQQGEKVAADVLRRMGADVSTSFEGTVPSVTITGKPLSGVEFDGDLATDAVLALMGAASLAKGRTRFYNVSNLRLKECDRISEPLAELRRIGVQCWEGWEIGDPDRDAIIIDGNPDGYEGGVDVDGRKDHRVIMMLSIVALRCRQGLRIATAEHIAKSYPDYFAHLAALGVKVSLQDDPHVV